jgi:hypothetical protein
VDTKAAGILGVCIVIAALIVSLPPRGRNESDVGRYQFARSNGVNCFVLDTKTGRLWSRFVASTGGGTDWSEDKGPWVEAQGAKPAK